MLRTLLPALVGLSVAAYAQPNPTSICQTAAKAALTKFPNLKGDQFSISLALIDRTKNGVANGDYQGDVGYYPASVVKLFMIIYAAQLLQNSALKLTPEFDRAARDMIVDSSNDAMALVMDTITETTGGPELPPAGFKIWQHKRNAMNRFYLARGYKNINVNQKTWNEGPYGRERQSLGPNYEYRNSLTANACVKLMASIALGTAVTGHKEGTRNWLEWAKGYLHRTIPADDPNADYQSKAFTGGALPKGSQLWSKAGYTDTARHDVAWVKLPDGKEFVLSVFTKDNSQNEALIPYIGGLVVDAIETGKA